MADPHPNTRLEAFCDGVFAIAITLLVLDLRVPSIESVHSVSEVWRDIVRLWPAFFALCFSFSIILISWVGHHNLLLTLDKTSPQFQFANGFFLLTVILLPFSTSFMAEYLDTPYAGPGIVVYCANSLLNSIGWNLLHTSILIPKSLVKDSVDAAVARKAAKAARYGFVIYLALLLMAVWWPYVALTGSVSIWTYWLYLSVSIRADRGASVAGHPSLPRAKK
jgi:uncharacterized membrane protein